MSGSTYWPPNSCIPKRAKTTMNRKRRNNRLMMDFMELRRETTRFLRDAQYLPTETKVGISRVCTLDRVPSSSPHQSTKKPQNLLCDFENTQ